MTFVSGFSLPPAPSFTKGDPQIPFLNRLGSLAGDFDFLGFTFRPFVRQQFRKEITHTIILNLNPDS
jgi:hypothetical protein